MALVAGQAVLSTAATMMFQSPAGAAVVTVTSDTASTANAWIGPGTGVTSSNSLVLIPGGSVSYVSYPTSKGAAMYGISGAASASTLSWLISSDG
jgi:hypothetical protein